MSNLTETADANISLFHWRLQFLLGLNLTFSAVEVSSFSSALAQIVRDWSLSPSEVGWLTAANATGALFGAVIIGNIADRTGRKPALQLVILLLTLGTALSGFAWDLASLAIFQFIAGIGVGGMTPSALTLLTEFAPTNQRGQLMGLLNSFWIAGWVMAAALAYVLVPQYGWRTIFFIGILPILYIPVVRTAIPESPRHLLAKGRLAAARAVVKSVEKVYGVKLAAGLAAPTRGISMKQSFLELWSPGQARRTVCTWILWFVVQYSFNGIFIWLPTLLTTAGQEITRSFEFALVIVLAQLPGVFAASFLSDRVGRKRVLVPSFLLGSLAAYFFGHATNAQGVLIWGCLVSIGIMGGSSVIIAYTPELYPTRVRATGIGLATASGRVGSIAAPIMMGAMAGNWNSNYASLFWMFAVVLFCGGLSVAVLGEETKGRTLEEIAT